MRVSPWTAVFLVACAAPAGRGGPQPSATRVEGAHVRSPAGTLQAGTLLLGPGGLGALALFEGEAQAQVPAAPGAGPAPVDIRADTLSLDGAAQRAVFAGSVLLRRGPMRLSCDRLTATYGDAGAVVSARAEGSVRFERSGLSVAAPSAMLDLGRGEVVLTGPARLQRGSDFIEGDRIVVAIDREHVTVQGARGQLRVAMGAGGAP